MTATDRLNAMQQRCDAATEGPWKYDVGMYGYVALPEYATTIDTGLIEEDAQFAAHARTDLPATIAALRAVIDLHPRIEAHYFATYECANCLEPFPCSTVRAITEALT